MSEKEDQVIYRIGRKREEIASSSWEGEKQKRKQMANATIDQSIR